MGKKLALVEKDISSQIQKLLRSMGAKVLQTHGQIWSKIPPEPGLADLLVCHKGRFVAIEVKRPGLKPTRLQQSFLDSVDRAGGIAFMADCVEDVIHELGLDCQLYPLFRHEAKNKKNIDRLKDIRGEEKQ